MHKYKGNYLFTLSIGKNFINSLGLLTFNCKEAMCLWILVIAEIIVYREVCFLRK